MSKKGFSLVEVLITGALLGGLALVGINLTKQSKVSSTKMQFDTDMTLTTNEINAILSDPTKCLATLGSTSSPTNINGKFFTVSSGSAPANGYGNSGLVISGYKFGGTAPNGLLSISYKNKNLLKGSSGASTFTKTVNIYFEGTVGAVTKCRSLATSSTDIWNRGSGSNINYNGGNVGIGTNTPITTLDVRPPNPLCPMCSPSNLYDGLFSSVMPGAWGGGIHTWDLYANGTIATGLSGHLAAYLSAVPLVGSPQVVDAPQDCPAGWYCTGHFWDISLSGVYYNVLSQRSDKRLKKDIHPIAEETALNILKLEPVTYLWKEKVKKKGVNFGLIAQDVEKVFPNLISKTEDKNKTLSLDYTQLISPIIKTIQVLFDDKIKKDDEIEKLKLEMALLKEELQKLKRISK